MKKIKTVPYGKHRKGLIVFFMGLCYNGLKYAWEYAGKENV